VKIDFPSREFDEAVAAVCHGLGSSEQMRALNELLRANAAARDEYLFRAELHTRLASDPDLFAYALDSAPELAMPPQGARASARFNVHQPGPQEDFKALSVGELKWRERRAPGARVVASVLALAACVALLAAGWWVVRLSHPSERKGATSKAVAMLNRVVDAEWGDAPPRLGAPLEPGTLRLKSGLAQIVFYSGARVVIEGPAEVQLISPDEVTCPRGRLVAEVPPPAHGFRVRTPQMNVTDLGTAFGLDVKERRTELHVFEGSVEFQPAASGAKQTLKKGAGAVSESSRSSMLIPANAAAFASLFELQLKSSDAAVLRHEQWRAASRRLNEDPSLLVHLDFESADPTEWRLANTSTRKDAPSDATIVGCQWIEGRWLEKRALEFRNVSDRVRLNVPGEYESLTLAAWVRVQGLDRQFNSLFMSDGFDAGTLHWLIRNDGVLGLTVIGSGQGEFQIVKSPSVLALDEFGLWLHLAVVLDGSAKRVAHYVNGVPMHEQALKIQPPFRVGAAELGNWNASGFPGNDPALIRNFSGAMDEFCLFSRVLSAEEIRALYAEGKPQPDSLIQTRN
jgi:hypothetical protein